MCCLTWSSSSIRKKDQSQPSQGTSRVLQEHPAFTKWDFSPYQQTEALSEEGSALPHTPVGSQCGLSGPGITALTIPSVPNSSASAASAPGRTKRGSAADGALTRDKDALHKQTPLHTTAAPEHLECTSGWVHIWQHLPSLLPVSDQKQQLYQDTGKNQSTQDRTADTALGLERPFFN